jgi:heme iron utilization protein
METAKREGVRTAAELLRAGGTGSLAVIDLKSGGPFVTLVNAATDAALRPLILTSELSHHTQCLRADPRASFMLHASLPDEGDPLTTLRLTLKGLFYPTERGEVESRFLARHPYAKLYSGFGDFGYWRMEPEHVHIIAGFGRAYSVPFADLPQAA